MACARGDGTILNVGLYQGRIILYEYVNDFVGFSLSKVYLLFALGCLAGSFLPTLRKRHGTFPTLNVKLLKGDGRWTSQKLPLLQLRRLIVRIFVLPSRIGRSGRSVSSFSVPTSSFSLIASSCQPSLKRSTRSGLP